ITAQHGSTGRVVQSLACAVQSAFFIPLARQPVRSRGWPWWRVVGKAFASNARIPHPPRARARPATRTPRRSPRVRRAGRPSSKLRARARCAEA
ncbi:hypothetical protein T492DRAFT_902563, partial [Pavlovales sp. CCMP2436]